MSRSRRIPCALLVLVSAAMAPLHAQSRPVFFMMSAGPAVPIGSFSDGYGAGWSATAAVGTTLSKVLEVRGSLGYSRFGASGGVDASSAPVTVSGDVLYRLGREGAKARPYLVGGLGFASVGSSYDYSYEGGGNYGGSGRENALVVGAGAGLLVQAGRTGFFAEGRLVSIGSGHSHVPLAVGVRVGR